MKQVAWRMYVTYKHALQALTEIVVLKRREKEREPEVLRMDYWYHYPEQIEEPMKEAGFEVQKYDGYDLKPYDVGAPNKTAEKQKMDVIVFEGVKKT
jgi:hypothetical protein